MSAIACKSLIYRVVDNFVNKVVQTSLPGRSDVHTGTFAHSLKSFEHLNLFGVVLLIYLKVGHLFVFHFITS